LHDIIPETEWKLLSVNALERAGSENDRTSLLFHRKSYWINGHVERLIKESGKGKKKSL
jgi:DNA-directed RNA polymerase I subunit RPA49